MYNTLSISLLLTYVQTRAISLAVYFQHTHTHTHTHTHMNTLSFGEDGLGFGFVRSRKKIAKAGNKEIKKQETAPLLDFQIVSFYITSQLQIYNH
jgi:hypothetical protein